MSKQVVVSFTPFMRDEGVRIAVSAPPFGITAFGPDEKTARERLEHTIIDKMERQRRAGRLEEYLGRIGVSWSWTGETVEAADWQESSTMEVTG